jgi:hypothetical protein
MRANNGDARMCNLTNVCTTFAVIHNNILYYGIVDGPLDVGDNENLIARSLVLFRSPNAGEIDVVVSCKRPSADFR